MSSKEYHREWYKQNREKEKAKVKANREARPEIRQSWLKLNGHKPKVRFDKAKSKGARHGWHLTFEQYAALIANPCFYCAKDTTKDRGIGLDRIDHKKGYEVSNVVPACGPCNVGRNVNFTPEEWQVAMRAVFAFRSQKT